ncbi:MAG: ester cyclase [Acidimicrobiales bacterium]
MDSIDIARVIFEEGWNRQDFSNAQRLLAPQFPLHIGGATRLTNANEFATTVGTWHAAFPNFRFDIHSITADDDMAAVRATLHGTHEGPWGDMQPTGRSIAVEHAFFLRIENGLVTEVWEILDRSMLEAQLADAQDT